MGFNPFKSFGKAIGKVGEGLGDMAAFERENLTGIWAAMKEDPERMLLGAATPVGSKVWGEITGEDYEPMVNVYGGPTQATFQRAAEKGINVAPSAMAHQFAQMVAGGYAGGYDFGGLSANPYVSGALTKGADYALAAAAADPELGMGRPVGPTPWSSGPAYYMPPTDYANRQYDFSLVDPYGYGYGGEHLFTGYEGGKVMGYSKGGRAEFKKAKDMTEQIGAIAQVPGGLEMLITMAAEQLGGPKGGKTKQLRLYNMGGEVKGYQQGGLSQIMEQQQGTMGQQAEEVRQAGRGDDEMLLHLAPEEYEALTSMWGPPDINPNTGIPEYGFLSKLWKGIKKTVKKIVKSPLFSFIAPIALNVFAPGLGSAIGGWMGATGKAAATIGNTVLRTGIGALSGGKEGAISGALSGLTMSGVGADIGKKLGLKGATARIAGDALMGGAAGEATGVGFKAGAVGHGMQSLLQHPAQRMEQKITDIGRDIFKPMGGEFDVTPGMEGLGGSKIEDPYGIGYTGYGDAIPGPEVPVGEAVQAMAGLPTTAPAGPGTSVFGTPLPIAEPSMWDKAAGWMKEHPWLTAGGAIAGAGALGMFDSPDEDVGESPFTLPPEFTESLPNLSFDRTQLPVSDYSTYGQVGAPQAGEAQFFESNVIPAPGVGDVSALPGLGAGYIPPGGWRGAPGAGSEPIPVDSGISGMMRRSVLQSQGWTFDPNTNMLYPPGYVGAGGGSAGAGGAQLVALGGLVQKYQTGGHVRGPGTGRSDEIPAVLSDGEYVIDSESVALLGDGSTDAGARRLDEMRENLRKHKSKKLAKGGFSDAAKKPEKYMQEGGYVPPKENPYKKGTARYRMWERKYGKKKPEKKPQTVAKKDNGRRKSRTERELEKLGEGMQEGGKVKSKTAFKELGKLANRLEEAITTGNDKRAKEIADQLDSLSPGTSDDLIKGFALGGRVMAERQLNIGKGQARMSRYEKAPFLSKKDRLQIGKEAARNLVGGTMALNRERRERGEYKPTKRYMTARR